MWGVLRKLQCAVGSHDWQDTSYSGERSCVLLERCSRCAKSRAGTTVHEFPVQWQYAGPASCQMVHRCQRCGQVEPGPTQHTWGDWQPDLTDADRMYQAIRHRLFVSLDELYSMEELRLLYAALGVSFDDLPGDTQQGKARELVLALERDRRLADGVRTLSGALGADADLKRAVSWDDVDLSVCSQPEVVDRALQKPVPLTANGAQCYQQRVCSRCQARDTQSAHQWGEWSQRPGVCHLVRTCARCHESEQGAQIPHQWDSGVVQPNGSDTHHTLARTCARCGISSSEEQPHEWNIGPVRKTDSATHHDVTKSCELCAVRGVEQEAHEWDTGTAQEIGSDTYHKRIRTCNLCRFRGVEQEAHEWDTGTVQQTGSDSTHERTRICDLCRARHVEHEDHEWGLWETKQGVRSRSCVRCGDEHSELLPASSEVAPQPEPRKPSASPKSTAKDPQHGEASGGKPLSPPTDEKSAKARRIAQRQQGHRGVDEK